MHDFDNIELADLIEWLETGDASKVPPKMAAYMEMLDKIWRMHRRSLDFPTPESIVKHLVIVDTLKRPTAVKLVKDSLTYFSAENVLSKDTWKQIIADKMLRAFTLSIRMVKTSRDVLDSVKILIALGDMLDLKTADLMEMEEDLMKQLQILTTDIEMFGLQKANRHKLGTFIDGLPDVPEAVKEKAREEVDRIPFRFLKFGDPAIQKEKSEEGKAWQQTES